jgi:methionyl-tRNA synthetase
VWFDALLNYATAVGYQQPARAAEYKKWWLDNPPVHLVGKDILTTHTVYWPTMLMALGVPVPTTIFGHGWWLIDGEKMSKSQGKVVSPLEMKDVVGVDPLRYFLTRDIHFGADASFSPELVVTRVNAELANNLGNLLSRVTNLVDKAFAGAAPALPAAVAPESAAVLARIEGLADRVEKKIRSLDPQGAVLEVLELLNDANKYIGDRAPWKQVKEPDLGPAAETLAVGLEVLRVAGILWSPIMPTKCAALLKIIGHDRAPSIQDARTVRGMKPGAKVEKPEPLFPRVDLKA